MLLFQNKKSIPSDFPDPLVSAASSPCPFCTAPEAAIAAAPAAAAPATPTAAPAATFFAVPPAFFVAFATLLAGSLGGFAASVDAAVGVAYAAVDDVFFLLTGFCVQLV